MKRLLIYLLFVILLSVTSCSTFRAYTVEDTKEGRVVAIEHVEDYWRGQVTDVYFDDGQVIRVNLHLILAIYGNYQFMYYDKSWHLRQSSDYPTKQEDK